MFTYIRWALIPVVIFLGWYLALLISIGIHAFAESLCPSEHIVSGMCFASWFTAVSKSIICLGAGLAAVFIVLFSAIVAPAKKVQVILVVYSIGAMVAIFWAFQINAFAELVAAVISGLITVLVLNKKLKKSA